MNIYNFIFGPTLSMEKTAYSWWNAKRKEYNIKFLSCLVLAQILFALMAISSAGSSDISILQRITGVIMADLLFMLLINLIYFLWPTLEIIFFKKIYILYRKYFFAVLNIISILMPISALIIILINKV